MAGVTKHFREDEMMRTRRLHDREFHATLVEPMRNITGTEREAIEIWRYYNANAPADLHPFCVDDPEVELVYRAGNDHYDHVLIPTRTKNVYLVLVVDLFLKEIVGQHVLNLNDKYGLPTPVEQPALHRNDLIMNQQQSL